MKLKLRIFAGMLFSLAGIFAWQLNQIKAGIGYWKWLFDNLPSLGCRLIDVAFTGVVAIIICVAAISGVCSESKFFRGFSMVIVIANMAVVFFWWIAVFGKADMNAVVLAAMICFVFNMGLTATLGIKPEA
jgi:hypothetical protein